ncbi:MAG: hypothetical protein J6J27_05790, partial [Alphaproteobacteria bacterium]|nr:hypothetical protein [Alphaproteobacteria bacterium]
IYRNSIQNHLPYQELHQLNAFLVQELGQHQGSEPKVKQLLLLRNMEFIILRGKAFPLGSTRYAVFTTPLSPKGSPPLKPAW